MLQFRKRTKLYILYIYMFFFPSVRTKKVTKNYIHVHFTFYEKKYDKNIENNKNEDQGAKTLLKPNKGRNAYYQ